MKTFEEMIEPLLISEGGFQDDPVDHGNWTGGRRGVGENKGTNWGISAARYPDLDIKALTREVATELYRRDFYRKYNMHRLPDHLKYIVFDHGVNCGPRRAIRMLQMLAGVRRDGIIGPITIAASRNVSIDDYSDARAQYYKRLVQHWPTHEKYLRGWLARVSISRRKASLAFEPSPIVKVNNHTA